MNATTRRSFVLAGFGVVLALVPPALLWAANSPIIWIEAEDYAAQQGSGAACFAMPAAAGGACVDNGWGGQVGHGLHYNLEIESDFPAPVGDIPLCARDDGRCHGARDTGRGHQQIRGPDATFHGRLGVPTGRLEICRTAIALLRQRRAHAGRSLAGRQRQREFRRFLSEAERLETGGVSWEPPSGPEAVMSLGGDLCSLPCKSPVALPYSRRKAFVAGSGLLQSLLATPQPRGMGGNIVGPSLHVKLAGHGPWTSVEHTLANSPVPTVVTRFRWPEVDIEQAVFAAAPEEQGFFVRVTVTNKTLTAREIELVSLVRNAGAVQVADGPRLVTGDQPLLRAYPAPSVTVSAEQSTMPGPLGPGARLRHKVELASGASVTFDLQFLGEGLSPDEAHAAAVAVWQERLAPARKLTLPTAKLQFAFDASLRQMLMLMEAGPDDVRVLKGLQHYYGTNPYDTFQVSRALDAVGLRSDSTELLRHQLRHLKDDGIFEMWETGDLQKAGAEQWIVQGLAATALWNHYVTWRDEDWLREIAPVLLKSAQATLSAGGRMPASTNKAR